MKNRIKKYSEIDKKELMGEERAPEFIRDLARADDNGFAVAENSFGARSTDQDSDCWSDLWQIIKTKGSRFFR